MHTFPRGVAFIFLLVCSMVVLPGALVAQSAGNSGTVSGVVTDPTGAVVAGASVSKIGRSRSTASLSPPIIKL